MKTLTASTQPNTMRACFTSLLAVASLALRRPHDGGLLQPRGNPAP